MKIKLNKISSIKDTNKCARSQDVDALTVRLPANMSSCGGRCKVWQKPPAVPSFQPPTFHKVHPPSTLWAWLQNTAAGEQANEIQVFPGWIIWRCQGGDLTICHLLKLSASKSSWSCRAARVSHPTGRSLIINLFPQRWWREHGLLSGSH